MSHNPSRPDRSEYRKTGRSGNPGQQRQFSGSGATQGGGGAPFSAAGNRSFKNYVRGGQPGPRNTGHVEAGDSTTANAVQNGAHQPPPQTQRISDPPGPIASANVNPWGAKTERMTQIVPKVPSSASSSGAPTANVSAAATTSETNIPRTPAKAPQDPSKSFTLQFGSISPGVMNGMQIPARTSSAPPNLDEQKKAQAQHSTTIKPAAPTIPPPPFPKQQFSYNHTNAGEAQPVPKPKRDVQFPPPTTATNTQKPQPLQFHQPPVVPVQYGGHNPHLQAQPMQGTSLPMPMPLSLHPPVPPHSMFVPGLQPHLMQPQGLFSSQMNPQIPPQAGNMGMSVPPQFPHQHTPMKFGGSTRKAVKITHPETHEELRLESSQPVPKPHANVPPNVPINFYPNSYNGPPVFLHPANSVPLSTSQIPPPSQPPRSYSQVTIRPPVSSQGEKNKGLLNSVSVGKTQKEAVPLSSVPEPKPTDRASYASAASSGPINADRNLTSASIPVEKSESASTNSSDEVGTDKHKKPEAIIALKDQGDGLGVEVLDSKFEPSRENTLSETEDLQLAGRTTSSEEIKTNGEPVVAESPEPDEHSITSSLKPASLESAEISGKMEESSLQDESSDVKMNDDSVLVQGDEVSKSDNRVDEKDKTSAGDFQGSAPVLSQFLSRNDSSSPKDEEPENSKDTANVTNVAPQKLKKKKKDLYRKAEAAGTSSDLYMAYKGPEDKKDLVVAPTDGSEKSLTVSMQQKTASEAQNDAADEKPSNVKLEVDDWEDAAEVSSPQLAGSKIMNEEDKNGSTTKSYSRDFLLKFKAQCRDLPLGFEISPDLSDALVTGVNVSPHPSPGRNVDRHNVGPARSSGSGEEDKWNRFPGPLIMGRGDMRGDFVAGNVVGFRPGQGGGHYGAMRNPRAQAPFPYGGGILTGPMQSPNLQGGLMRNNSDSDRWQRGTGFTKGLMPSPQTPTPVMHRAEKKYEVGKVTDEEEVKQRQLKAILNKLTPQNFEKLFQQVNDVNIDNVVTLSGVISQIFDKALMEPTFCEMYADFCFHLAKVLPDLSAGDEKITFKRLLVNKCQEEFERGEREEEEANKLEEEDKQTTPEEREEKRVKARRRMLGNIRLIGELYKKRMLTERIMHGCINKLLYENPDEENIEALCKLMSTIGEMIDHPKSKDHLDAYFNAMGQLSNDPKISVRVRFMLRDSIDLRKNKWQQRRKVEGPKKIEEVHRDAAQERHAQASRLARGPSMGGSARRDLGPRSPGMVSPGPQTGGYRPTLPQTRGAGYGSQDFRTMDERHSFENRGLQTQKPLGENTITLGPQGGLAQGMAYRGQPSPGHNGLGSGPERAAYGPRYVSGKFGAPNEQPNLEELKISYGNRDARNVDRSGLEPQNNVQNVSSETVWSEEVLQEKSMAAIKEFYSARDENEVALCIKELNAPSFYPTMISTWVTDSFERKDMERDLLTKLLINLTRGDHSIITQEQLLKGFESVLLILEDAVNDAPKAADFLGRMFAKVITENITSLSEIGRLVSEGGEEPGRLIEIGLGSEVIGSIFEIIEAEKGDSVLSEIRSGSNLRLESFRPPGSSKTLRIDKFIT